MQVILFMGINTYNASNHITILSFFLEYFDNTEKVRAIHFMNSLHDPVI